MAGDWQVFTFDDLIKARSLNVGDGYRAKRSELGGGGPIFLRAGHVRDTHIDFDGVDRFQETLADRVAPKMSQVDDVIVTTKGNSTGRVAFVDKVAPPFVYSPHLSYWRSLDDNVVVPGFLRYWSRSREFRDQLSGLSGSTDMAPYLSLIDQRRLTITLPPAKEQRAIAHILGALDDKIELNRRMNETLEAMARALFKSWFVDFDPVRAKMEGRWRPGQSLPGLPADLYELFPEKLVASELGEIPEGWEVRRADEVADISIGKTPPRKEPQWFSTDDNDIRWMSIKDMGKCDAYITETSEYLTEEAVEMFRVRRIPGNTVVLSFKLTVGRVAITDGEMLSNEAIAHFKLGAEAVLTPGYLYCYLSNFRYESLGSTSSIARAINSKMVKAMPVFVADKDVVVRFQASVEPIFGQLRMLAHESRTLAALRDTLLPKLISGELRVKDAERIAERAC